MPRKATKQPLPDAVRLLAESIMRDFCQEPYGNGHQLCRLVLERPNEKIDGPGWAPSVIADRVEERIRAVFGD